MPCPAEPSRRPRAVAAALALVAALSAGAASAQSEGGLYIAGAEFGFQATAQRALAQNGGARFFLLALPPESAALLKSASPAQTALRNRVVAAKGMLLVCQRDVDKGRIPAARLAPGVVAVRGWPQPGGAELPDGQRYFRDEDPAQLPASNDAMRRLRSACS